MGDKKGKIVIISGPSGVGKSTICREVVKRLDNIYLSVSATTRPKAKDEVDGRDYWFISNQQFAQWIKEGKFLEYAEVFGNLYGTPKDKVEQALAEGKTVILEIDVAGARQVKAIYPQAKMIFIFPPNQKELARRMDNRGRENAIKAWERLSGADAEMAAANELYEYKVVNDDLQAAVSKVVQIIRDL